MFDHNLLQLLGLIAVCDDGMPTLTSFVIGLAEISTS